jgi:hypothetical protein
VKKPEPIPSYVPFIEGTCGVCKRPKRILVIRVPKNLSGPVKKVKICAECVTAMYLVGAAKRKTRARVLPTGWKQKVEKITVEGKPFLLSIGYTEIPKKVPKTAGTRLKGREGD